MRSFVKLIFILVFCHKFVVPANNTHEWLVDESSTEVDRRHRNLNTSPEENDSQNHNLHQTFNKNLASKNDREISSKQDVNNSKYVLPREQEHTPQQRENFDMQEEKLLRDEEIPYHRKFGVIDDVSRKNREFKSMNLNRTPLEYDNIGSEFKDNEALLNNRNENNKKEQSNLERRILASNINLENIDFLNDSPNESNDNSNFNKEKIPSNKHEKSSNVNNKAFKSEENLETISFESNLPIDEFGLKRENFPGGFQSSPLRTRNEPYKRPGALSPRRNYNIQNIMATKDEEDDYYFENEKQYKEIPKSHPVNHKSFKRVETTKHAEEPLMNRNVRPEIDTEELYYPVIHQLHPQYQARNTPQYEPDNNRKSNKFEQPIINQESLNLESNNPNIYTTPLHNQNQQFTKAKSPRIPIHNLFEITGYDESVSDLPTQQRYRTKPVQPKNSSGHLSSVPQLRSLKVSNPRHSAIVDSRENVKHSSHPLQKHEQLQKSSGKTDDNFSVLDETKNLAEENIFTSDEINFKDSLSSKDGFDEIVDSTISEHIRTNTKDSSSASRHHNSPTNNHNNNHHQIEQHPIVFEDINDEMWSNRQKDIPDVRTHQKKSIAQEEKYSTNQESNSKKQVYINDDYERLEAVRPDKMSLNKGNQVLLNNGSGKKIEIDINYLLSDKYGSTINDHVLNGEQRSLTVDNKRKLLTTFTRGMDVKQILNKVKIQEHLKKFKTKYIVVYPNGTVEHMDEIDSVLAKYPHYVLIKSGNIIAGPDGIDLKLENENFDLLPSPIVKNKGGDQNVNDNKSYHTNSKIQSSSVVEHNKTDKVSKHIIPVILNNKKEKHTYNLNNNIPLTVDFSGPIEEIDINYFLDEGSASINNPKDQESTVNNEQKNYVDNISVAQINNKKQTEVVQPKSDSTKHSHIKNFKPNTLTKIISNNEQENDDISSDDLSLKTASGIQENQNIGLNISQETDTALSETKSDQDSASSAPSHSSTSNTDSQSKGVITSLLSDLFDLFSKRESSKIGNNQDNGPNLKDIDSKSNSKAEITTQSPIELSQYSSGDNLTSDNHVQKRRRSRGKKRKHRRDSEILSQSKAQTDETLHDQEKDHGQNGTHKHHTGSNSKKNDVPNDYQEITQKSVGETKIANGPIHEGTGHNTGHQENQQEPQIKNTLNNQETQGNPISVSNKHSELNRQNDETITLSPIETPQHSHVPSKKNERHGDQENRSSVAIVNQKNDRAQQHDSYKDTNDFDGDEIVTLSPMEVPQEPSHNSHSKKMHHRYREGHPQNPKENVYKYVTSSADTTNNQWAEMAEHGAESQGHTDSSVHRSGHPHANRGILHSPLQHDDSQGIDLSRLLKGTKPMIWNRGLNQQGFEEDVNKNGHVVVMFNIENRVEKETKTTIFPNGTIFKEYIETIYKDDDDQEPTVLRTTEVIQPDGTLSSD